MSIAEIMTEQINNPENMIGQSFFGNTLDDETHHVISYSVKIFNRGPQLSPYGLGYSIGIDGKEKLPYIGYEPEDSERYNEGYQAGLKEFKNEI